MPASIFAGPKVKALKSTLSLNGGADVISSTTDPTSVAVDAAAGSLLLNTTSGKLYRKNDSGSSTNWSEVGSGGSGINYVTNPSAATNTTGWSTYADAAGTQPVDGTGGSPTVTWTRSTTTPLRGAGDFNFTKDAANRQGEGVATDITIDLADQAKVLTVSFDYEVLSGTYATGDLTVYLIADPSGTPVVIQPAGYQIQSGTAGTKLKQIATFQTQATGQSYRVCFHVASTSASAYSLAIDNVVVGPQAVQYGAPVTDWVSYTPTGDWVANTTYTGKWRRVGDSMEAFVTLSLSNAPVGVLNNINLPSGYSIDTSKMSSSTSGGIRVGYGLAEIASVYPLMVFYQSATSVRPIYYNYGGDGSGTDVVGLGINATTQPGAFGSGDFISVYFQVPILGWSSTVQMSNDTDTRVVAARISVPSGAQTLTNNVSTKITGLSAEFDTHGAFNSSLQRYEIKVPGVYRVTWQVGILSSATDRLSAQIYKTGSLFTTTYIAGSSQGAAAPVSSTLISCTTSDYLEFYAAMEGTPTRNTNPGSNSIFASIERLSGPSAIAATETVAFSGQRTAGNYALNNSSQTITWSAVIDTHGGYSGTTYTVPISGLYEAYVYIQFENADAGTYCGVNLIAGSTSKRAFFAPDGGNVNYRAVQVSNIVRLVAGQTISVVGLTSGVADIRASLADENCFTVKRIGN